MKTNHHRAKKNGERLATAVREAKALSDNNAIITFLLNSGTIYDLVEGFDASSLTLPATKSGGQIVLGYEWQFLEDARSSEISQDIFDSIEEALRSGQLPNSIDEYEQ